MDMLASCSQHRLSLAMCCLTPDTGLGMLQSGSGSAVNDPFPFVAGCDISRCGVISAAAQSNGGTNEVHTAAMIAGALNLYSTRQLL